LKGKRGDSTVSMKNAGKKPLDAMSKRDSLQEELKVPS
jgi:hypothetical protein